MAWTDYDNSFSGNIDSIPYIGVDNFYDKTKKAYFLSHFHTDHTGGLIGNYERHSCELNRKNVNIYMSRTTAVIFRHHYTQDYNILRNQIIILETDNAYNLVINGEKLEVTLVPVDHMPGAVMFLFKVALGDSGNEIRTILYTGDFVITNDNLQEAYPSLHDNGKPIHIDEMYCDDSHKDKFGRLMELPIRSTVLRESIELIRNWLAIDENNAVAIYTFYDYAYEKLFGAISEETGQRIALSDPTRLAVYSEIFNDEANVYTGERSKIHVYSEIQPGEEKQPTMNVMRIHVKWFNKPEVLERITNGPNPEYSLNYPTHCSRSQLDKFVEYFEPEEIQYFPSTRRSATV